VGKSLIKEAVREVDENFIVDRVKVNADLDKALKSKYEKVEKDEKKYIELLRYNIIFYKSIIKKLESILEVWIQNDVIFSPDSVDKSIENITDSSRKYVNNAMKNGNKVLNEKDKKIFVSYDKNTGFKRIEKIENDYKILNLYKDILGMVINVISLDVDKYNPILEMSTESAKIDVMNEIFNEINSILFTGVAEKREFKDEALVDDEQVENEELQDEHKSISFIKYVSMLSAPEVLVKINDVFRKTSDMEKVADDSHLFSEDYKAYVSCVVLLMDYVSMENRRLFANTFRLFVSGKIGQKQFKEIVERLVRDNTFMDKRSLLECQSIVRCDFNMENANFFGENEDFENDELSTTQYLRLVESFNGNGTIAEEADSIYEYEDEFAYEESPKKKRFGLGKFFNKIDTNDEDYDDEFYDDEIEDYDDEYAYDEYEVDEEYDTGERKSFLSKLGSFFSKSEESEDYEVDEDSMEYQDEEDDYEDIPIPDSSFRSSQKEIQDKNAVAILKLKRKSESKENIQSKKELDKLKDERNLTEKLNENIMAPYLGNSDIVVKEEDLIFKNGVKLTHDSENQNDKLNLSANDKEQNDNEASKNIESSEGKLVDVKKKEESVSKKDSHNDDLPNKISDEEGRFEELEDLISMKNHDEEDQCDKYEHDEDEYEEKYDEEFEDVTSLSLKERYDAFREKRANKKVEREIKKYSKDTELDEFEYDEPKKIFGFSKKSDSEDLEYLESDLSDSEDYGDKDSKLGAIKGLFSMDKSDDVYDEEGKPIFSKARIMRDSIVVVGLMLVVFFGYTHVIKNFSAPSVSETNKISQQKADKRSSDSNSKSVNTEDTKELAKKNSKIEEEDAITKQASELDREADNYKNKGAYYTVFVGATKDKDGAQSVANNFEARGVKATVIRHAGYYMLKVGEYPDINTASVESSKISSKGIQNYVATLNKYYDLKIQAFETRIPKLSAEQLKTDYNDLKNQIASSGKNAGYLSNLDEVYETGLKSKQ